MDLALQDPSVRGPDVEKICDVSGMVALGLVLQEGQGPRAADHDAACFVDTDTWNPKWFP